MSAYPYTRTLGGNLTVIYKGGNLWIQVRDIRSGFLGNYVITDPRDGDTHGVDDTWGKVEVKSGDQLCEIFANIDAEHR